MGNNQTQSTSLQSTSNLPEYKIQQIRGMRNLRLIRDMAMGIGAFSSSVLIAQATGVVKFSPAIVPTTFVMVSAFLTAAAAQTLIGLNQYIERQINQPV